MLRDIVPDKPKEFQKFTHWTEIGQQRGFPQTRARREYD